MTVVFAKTRWHYESYQDFWKLVELSGYESCYVDEIDLTAPVTFVATPWNGEFEPVLQAKLEATSQKRARVVWWNCERHDMPALHDVITNALRYVDEVWVYDRHYQSLDARQKLCIVGSHPGLRLIHEATAERYDYCHMSYVSNRRYQILARLREAGLDEGPSTSDRTRRDEILRQSRILVNTHQTEAPVMEGLRVALGAAYSRPLVSEPFQDPYPLRAGEHYIEATPSGLVSAVRELLALPEAREQLGRRLHQALCVEHSFRSEVDRAAGDNQ